MSDATVKPPDSFEYYRGTIYWNNFDIVLSAQNKLIAGDSSLYWHHHILKRYGKRKLAFVFSCGNGWVERDLFQKGVIQSVTAFDILPNYIEEARSAAKKLGMQANYFIADGNTFEEGNLRCDLAVNVGAMHHIARINRMTDTLARICQNGIYVGYDYTGAHRNQYGWNVWSKVVETNQQLPEKYRIKLRYPHLSTMLHTDPSEAVHSELQMDTLRRHFDLLECRHLGGGVAYMLLYENKRLHAEQHTPEGRETLEFIMKTDAELLRSDPDFNLFTFFVAKPKKSGSIDSSQLIQWQLEEDEREKRAALNGGRYYAKTPLECIYDELADTEYKLSILCG